jgi:hypothetical protein
LFTAFPGKFFVSFNIEHHVLSSKKTIKKTKYISKLGFENCLFK